MSADIDQVARFVHSILKKTDTTARLVVTGDHKCLLYDLHQWTDAMSATVREKFPWAGTTVLTSHNSASGFIVVIVADADSYNHNRIVFFLLWMLVAMSLLWLLLSSMGGVGSFKKYIY